MKRISIVGFGRFGKVLKRLLESDFEIRIFDKNDKNLKNIYESDVVFYAVPISTFEEVIKKHKKYFKSNNLLIDVLSVKMHPAKVLSRYLKNSQTQAILTHPMFGPDSSKNGFTDLPIVMDKFKSSGENYGFWKNYFESKNLRVVEMTARQHDKLAASSQGLTHFVGRLLDRYGLESSGIDTLGVKKLLDVKEQTCNGSWQLFENLQHFNPYTEKMRIKLEGKYDGLFNKLLPKKVKEKIFTIGIQGGIGSFNEEAVRYFLEKEKITKFKINYLYTSEKVLAALHRGKIDVGQFAIHNSAGGIVQESIEAMAKYKFKIVNQYAIKISHALMIRKDANFNILTTIMTHPQVLAQCKNNLNIKYQKIIQTSGKGIYIDHAMVAKQLGAGKLAKNIGTMGSGILAKLYNLKIVEENLQDLSENYTTFLQVSRI